jgi:two-component system, OmpR family, response regulator
MARRIAIVEDEVAIRENYAAVLRKQGYEVQGYGSRATAMESFRQRLPDLVILDIGLGDEIEGGFDMCRDLRVMASGLPIIFLTARDSDFDAISGLRLGADDYLTKDISLPHILARIAALFRRVDAFKSPPEAHALVTVGNLQMDSDRLTVTWNEKPVDLTLTEFWIVHCLSRIPGHVKNREQLMQEANVVVDDSTITSHIKRIRKKFKAVDDNFDCVDTVYGMGYRWNA